MAILIVYYVSAPLTKFMLGLCVALKILDEERALKIAEILELDKLTA